VPVLGDSEQSSLKQGNNGFFLVKTYYFLEAWYFYKFEWNNSLLGKAGKYPIGLEMACTVFLLPIMDFDFG
jgi:hypothetical protein